MEDPPRDFEGAEEVAWNSSPNPPESGCTVCRGPSTRCTLGFGIVVLGVMLVVISAFEYRSALEPHEPKRGGARQCSFETLSRGVCSDANWLPITTEDSCNAVAEELGKEFGVTDAIGTPHGCFIDRDAVLETSRVWLGVNSASQGLGVETFVHTTGQTRELFCILPTMNSTSAVTGNLVRHATDVTAMYATFSPDTNGSKCLLPMNSIEESEPKALATLETLPAGAFPEVNYIFVPESAQDVERLEKMQEDMDMYVTEGRRILRLVRGVYPPLWPGSGRYDVVEQYGKILPIKDTVVSGKRKKWTSEHNLVYATVDRQGRSTCPHYNNCHHVGCGLSHFITWMEARQRGLQAIVVAESDGVPSRFQLYAAGDVRDYGSVIPVLLQEAPEGWHLIQLDKGAFGAQPGRAPLKRIYRDGWTRPYEVYRWTGEGVAGLALYMVSHRFLQQVPTMIHDHGFDMVDAYIDWRCGPNGKLQCFSVGGVHELIPFKK